MTAGNCVSCKKLPGQLFKLAEPLRDKILNGSIPDIITEQFRHMLDYFGSRRSSVVPASLLSDGFGNAFAGKYESIFCVNQGSPQERGCQF
jgi:hypothetical protein